MSFVYLERNIRDSIIYANIGKNMSWKRFEESSGHPHMVLNTTPTDVPYQRLFLLSNNFFKLYNFASPKLSRLNMLVYEKKYLPNEQWQETIQV